MLAAQPSRFAELHRREYRLLQLIQRAPGLRPVSLAVHYSLLPKVITPLLSLIVWLASLPIGASLICFVCAWVPCILDDVKDVHHRCGSCGKNIGVRQVLG